jgi:ribosomal protein S18 acetylase RimI-like enzyme
MALRMRAARAADAAAVAALHLASCRDAYRGVLADDFLDGPMAALLDRHWAETLAGRGRKGVVMLATAIGDPVGFVAAWRRGDSAHIENLHVQPGMRGAGIGRLLLGAAAERMAAQGCTAADLMVFAANVGAIRFYRALGAAVGPEEEGVAFGQRVVERRCAWPDIRALVTAARSERTR